MTATLVGLPLECVHLAAWNGVGGVECELDLSLTTLCGTHVRGV